ncbi:N,N-dimethylformamidase beta subunit family domain-containing protein [Nocardiopsis ansamitocini]|nr:N,N-dimethylformamidase beta subunit family domain-containing protein [Nocardiopsis ansamitocini]
MISAPEGTATLDLVRLVHGDENPRGPGFVTEPVDSWAPVETAVGPQITLPGSYLVAEGVFAGRLGPRTTLEVLAWPTTPDSEGVQGLLSVVDDAGGTVAALVLDHGRPAVITAEGTAVRLDAPLSARRWYRVRATLDGDRTQVCATAVTPFAGEAAHSERSGSGAPGLDRASGVLAAATRLEKVGPGRARPEGLYNGKLERPVVRSDGEVVAEWAFSEDHAEAGVPDVSGNRHHARLVNMPARAMTGHSWDGSASDPRTAPEQYGAIHFHDDDLIDAGWQVSARVGLPADLPSGIYAVRVRVRTPEGGETDHIPVVVRPADHQAKAPVAYLIPTFTYVAYANERLQHRLDYEAEGITDHPITPDRFDRALADHPEFGGSLYDHHSDGSGVCYSSFLRPIPNMRPDYRMWLQNAPRHLGADLYLIPWFRRQGFEYDVISDHDLHADPDLLDDYQVVVTGSHPEYHSQSMLDSIARHTGSGGSLMYLGGNGFYWVTSQDPERPHALEVRRSSGIRTWEVRPGEQHHSTTGEQGGLWRWRGRSPNAMLGVGMCSQGWDEKAPPFERTELSYAPEWSWVFEGVDDRVIGDFGLIMDGASGDEVDRCDFALGSPPNTAVLATSRRHSDYYQLAVEDVLMLAPGLGGSECTDVRSDMVVVEQPSGGAVFSVGSICFTGCVPVDDYDNNVSHLLRNVLRNFRDRGAKNTASAR